MQEKSTFSGSIKASADFFGGGGASGSDQKKTPWIYKLIPPAILSIITTLFYLPSLRYPFQFDDIANISKRFAIRFDNPFTRWWTNSRWFSDWLNTINFQIGRFDPFYYRLFNLVIHILAGVVLFYLLLDLCKALKNRPFFTENALFISFAASALFLLHPVQTQTVSYVIQARLEGLATLFILLTIFLFVRAFSVAKPIMRSVLLGAFFVTGMVSCGTKEIVIVTPFLLLLIDWFFLSQEEWSSFKQRLWIHAIFNLFFLGLMAHYLGFKMMTDAVQLKMSTGNNRGNILTPHAFDVITPFQFLISEFKVIVHYLTMFVWPFDISVEYDWKVSHSIFSVSVFPYMLVLLAIGAFILYSIFRRKNTMTVFGLLWFFVAIAPRSTIIPSPELVCDYKTYLASVGIVILLAVPLVHFFVYMMQLVQKIQPLPAQFSTRYMQTALLAVLFLPIGFAATSRNKVWETCVGFWEDNAKKAPGKARVHNNLGVALSEAGKVDEAIVAYKKAIELDSNYSDPLSNIAVAYSLKGQVDEAISSLKSALHICPNYPEAYNNIGTLLLQKKQYEEAERALSIAVQLRPYYGKAYYNLARMYEEKKDDEKAWEYLKKSTEGDLDIPEVFFKLGQMSLRVKKYKDAVVAFEKILERGYGDAQVWFNLANAYFMEGQHEKAQSVYERLVRDNPLDARYAYNLAETYYTKNDFVRAHEMFKKITSMPQPLPQAFFRTANCLERLNKKAEAKSYLEELLKVEAPDQFKQVVKNELTRMNLQEKVNAGDGRSIKLNDFKNALASGQMVEKKKNA